MARAQVVAQDRVLASAVALRALDTDYLAEQAFGDGDLERELLTLFERQCRALIPLILAPGPRSSRAEATHTLRGGALAVGAVHLAQVTDTLETTLLDEGGESELDPLLAGLAVAAGELEREIERWLERHA